MSDQLELLPQASPVQRARARAGVGKVPHAPYSDTDTSLEAAARAVPRARGDELRVLQALLERPDTDEGLGTRLNLPGNTVRPRRRGLEMKGLVEHDPGPDGEGAYGRTFCGRRAKLWRVKPCG